MKRFIKHIPVGIFVAMIVLLSYDISSGWKFRNRWQDRMEKDLPPSNDSTKSSGTPSAPTSAEGTQLHCRDGALLINRNIDSSDTSRGSSEVRVEELSHGQSKTVACTALAPVPYVSNYIASGGTVTVRCNSGQLSLVSSSCVSAAPSPTPTPTPTPPPPASGCPSGYSVVACGSCCADGVSSYRYCSGSMKNKTWVTLSYRSCQNGSKYNTKTGACFTSFPSGSTSRCY